MFKGFKKKAICPVPVEDVRWVRWAFSWLINNFGEELYDNKQILVPEYSSFPIQYNGQRESAEETLKIVAIQMDVLPEDIHLSIYAEGTNSIGTGGIFQSEVFVEQQGGHSGGLYWGRNEEDNKYHIGLEQKVLRDPEEIVATLAHEIAHIKLLGEGRLTENDEPLTDLATIVFGFGIFNANAAFHFKNTFDSWGYKRLGYLSQMQWGFALAYWAYSRNDDNPDWIKYLSADLRSDFKKSMQYILENEQLIFSDDL